MTGKEEASLKKCTEQNISRLIKPAGRSRYKYNFIISGYFPTFASVLKIFKSFNPQTVIILLLFAAGIKLGYFLHPPAVIIGNDEPAFRWIMEGLYAFLGHNSHLYVFLGIFNVVFQSLIVNRIATEYKLFPNDSFVPAAVFILLSSLLPAWNTMSAPLLANWLVLYMINNMLRFPVTAMPKKLLFNSGMCISTAMLLYYPVIIYIIFTIWSLLIIQQVQLKQIIIICLGLLTPAYFVVVFFYLLDAPFDLLLIEKPALNLPSFPLSTGMIIVLSVITLIILIAVFFLNNQMKKMNEAAKKSWWVIIVSIIVGNIVALLYVNNDQASWYFTLAPVSLLAAGIWMADYGKWVKIILFWLLLAAIIFVQWFL